MKATLFTLLASFSFTLASPAIAKRSLAVEPPAQSKCEMGVTATLNVPPPTGFPWPSRAAMRDALCHIYGCERGYECLMNLEGNPAGPGNSCQKLPVLVDCGVAGPGGCPDGYTCKLIPNNPDGRSFCEKGTVRQSKS
jgi:hypothetical protein